MLKIENKTTEQKVRLDSIKFGNIVKNPSGDMPDFRYLVVNRPSNTGRNDDVMVIQFSENPNYKPIAFAVYWHRSTLVVDCGKAEIVSPK